LLAALTIFASAALSVVPAATATTASHKRRHSPANHVAKCPGADAHVGSASRKLLQSAVVCLINQERAQHHLPLLEASSLLNRSAQGWTNVMVSSDQFSHGANFTSRISAAGYVWRSAGENIATGYSTPRGVVNAWMASTGHCQNILSPRFREVGTGVSRRPIAGLSSGGGTWTQDFGLAMGQPAPSANWGPAQGCPY
jgi:uncharacterized protein YkwD